MLEKNDRTIQVTDFGAGSKTNNNREKKISFLAKNSAKSEKVGRLLTHLCDYTQPKTAIELGTSLGISTLYQYSGVKSASWTTFEGCSETAKIAKKVFSSYKANNIDIVVGNFDHTLDAAIKNMSQLDYVFFDGNHQKKPTINYFESCLKLAHNNSLFVFDDIHWSEGMEEAWEYIKNHPKVTVTIDLFWVGLVFFKQEEPKEDFILRF